MSHILVTGVTGLVGSVLAAVLAEQGHTVMGASLPPGPVLDRAKWYPLDLAMQDGLAALPKGVETIIHCAAYIPADYSAMKEAELAWMVNGLGTLRLLQWATETGVSQFIYCSSQAVYQRPLPYPVDETHPAYPAAYATPYALSKLAGEIFVSSYRNQGFNACSVRFSAVYGPCMKPNGAIPKFIELARAAKAIELTEGPDTEFDLLYVNDACQSLTRLIQRNPRHAVYNVGAGIPTTLRELAEICWTTFQPMVAPAIIARVADANPRRTFLSIARIQEEFGYTPAYSVHEGLQTMKNTSKA